MSDETYAEIPYSSSLNTFATIDYCDSIGGYEWDDFRVLRGTDGLLYVHAAGGCSCYDFNDENPADFTPVANWQEAVKRLREWVREEDYMDRATVADELASRLADKRPRKRIAIDGRNPWGESR